jgi:hypothetical protein
MTTYIGFMIIALIVLNVLDAVSTIKVISAGKGKEANRVVRFLIEKLGVKVALIGTKALVIGWFIYSINTYGITNSTVYSLIGLNLLYLYTVISNYKVLNR